MAPSDSLVKKSHNEIFNFVPGLSRELKYKIKTSLDLLKARYHFQVKVKQSLRFEKDKSRLELNHLLSQMYGDYFRAGKVNLKKMIISGVIKPKFRYGLSALWNKTLFF